MRNVLDRVLCWWCRSSAPAEGPGVGSLHEAVARHRERCEVCVARTEALGAVERGLAGLADAGAADRRAPDEVRMRVLSAYHALEADAPAMATAPGWRERSVIAVGGLAAVILVGSLLWTRLPDFGEPPRTVRIELPPGYTVTSHLTVTIRRASGEVEVR